MKDEIREKVFTAIGEASMCWEPIPTGVFDSTAAQKVGERLVADLASAVAVEPLAVLADRKGYYISRIDGNGEDSHRWEIGMFQFTEEGEEVNWKGFEAPTYAECEAKARAYLNGLPDAAGKGDN